MEGGATPDDELPAEQVVCRNLADRLREEEVLIYLIGARPGVRKRPVRDHVLGNHRSGSALLFTLSIQRPLTSEVRTSCGERSDGCAAVPTASCSRGSSPSSHAISSSIQSTRRTAASECAGAAARTSAGRGAKEGEHMPSEGRTPRKGFRPLWSRIMRLAPAATLA